MKRNSAKGLIIFVIIINHQIYAARASNQSTNPKPGLAEGAWQKKVRCGIWMSLGMGDLLWFGRADLVCGSERQGFLVISRTRLQQAFYLFTRGQKWPLVGDTLDLI
jgi:hypothetical protein